MPRFIVTTKIIVVHENTVHAETLEEAKETSKRQFSNLHPLKDMTKVNGHHMGRLSCDVEVIGIRNIVPTTEAVDAPT